MVVCFLTAWPDAARPRPGAEQRYGTPRATGQGYSGESVRFNAVEIVLLVAAGMPGYDAICNLLDSGDRKLLSPGIKPGRLYTPSGVIVAAIISACRASPRTQVLTWIV
jgi:hypothetical protein